MTPDESMAVATWVGVGVAMLFGIGGVIVGAIGLVQARRARGEAKTANKLAAQSNSIASESNSIARKANRLSKGANRVSKAMAARSDEQHDVDWAWEWEKPGTARITNTGTDTAYKVRIAFGVDDETERGTVAEIAGGDFVRWEMPEAREAAREEEQQKRAPRGALQYVATSKFGHRSRLRVHWRTALGTPREYDRKADMITLGTD